MKNRILLILGFIILGTSPRLMAQDHRFDPPWNLPISGDLNFTVPGVDNVPDLFGEIIDPQWVIFFAGNQFMCIQDLLTEFKESYPQYTRIFAETLPPEILAKQIVVGNLVIGNLKIDLKPDVYTAGRSSINPLLSNFSKTETYALNKIALMVQKGNPKGIQGLKDLARKDVRVSMPNPKWEGIGKLIEKAYVISGGEELREKIMVNKLSDSTTYLTRIHHRESPMGILYNESDVAPVWYSEVFYQKMIHHPVEMFPIPESQNTPAEYMACQLKSAPHKKPAEDFMNFLMSPKAKGVYKKYGFTIY